VPFSERPLKTVPFRTETKLEALDSVQAWFKQFKTDLPDEIWADCEVALVEGFVNVVSHAHRNLPASTPIDIEVKVFRNLLEMRIWDEGERFDLAAKLRHKLENPPNPLKDTSGRGLFFMHWLTDEMYLTRTPDNRNCLVLRKVIRKPAG